MGGGRGFFSGGMGSEDVKLRYIDDDPASYSNIFENAKTDITEADQARLIASLKALSAGENLEEVLDIDQVLRYFVVHNFVCNGDSYTGSMVHNYYLYEKDGQLSMIPWDYNLAFGTFQSADATAEVNTPIDTPVSGGDSRPMSDWMFDSPEYTELYHRYFREFLETVDAASIIDAAAKLIAPYVEKDPSKFYSYEAFETGVETLKAFCRLRSESVMGQLDGSIPSTEAGQSAGASALVDASGLVLTDMGTMNRGGAGMEDQRSGMRRPGDGGFRQAGEGSEALPLRGADPPGGAPPEAFPSASPDDKNLLLLGASGAALLAGLAFAWRFRRRG